MTTQAAAETTFKTYLSLTYTDMLLHAFQLNIMSRTAEQDDEIRIQSSFLWKATAYSAIKENTWILQETASPRPLVTDKNSSHDQTSKNDCQKNIVRFKSTLCKLQYCSCNKYTEHFPENVALRYWT